jgi:hypothetical protein
MTGFSQTDTTKWIRAFPITDYIVELNDSVKVVQVELPDELGFKEKQPGLIRGVYENDNQDTVQKGYGRCHLIKGNYYYFSIGHNNSGISLKGGDLLYTFMDKTDIYYGQVPKLASHFIRLQDMYEKNFYDRYTIFQYWTEEMEQTLLDSMMSDIRFTGVYFLENDPSMDKPIISGDFKGRHILQVMKECQAAYVKDFLDYILAKPRLYAGNQWKLSDMRPGC